MTQTIEQLTARVRELEEENARLKVATNFGKSKDIHRLTEVVLSDCGISTEYRPLLEKVENRLYEFFDEQLATSQAYAEQLREALEYVDDTGLLIGQYVIHEKANRVVRKALAIQRDTSALDAYVAEKVKEARNIDKKQIAYLFEERWTLTRQRDLAVEALEKWDMFFGGDAETAVLTIAEDPSTLTGCQKATKEAMSAIKESEAK